MSRQLSVRSTVTIAWPRAQLEKLRAELQELAPEAEVLFRDAPGDRGTEVELRLEYAPRGGRLGRALARRLNDPPGGRVGRSVAELLGVSRAARLRTALREFKQLVEAGEVATTTGQPSGRAAKGRAA